MSGRVLFLCDLLHVEADFLYISILFSVKSLIWLIWKQGDSPIYEYFMPKFSLEIKFILSINRYLTVNSIIL